MANPLEKFVTVDEKEDGVYIVVPPELKGKTNLKDWRYALEMGQIINYEWDLIEDVANRATGNLENIGPPFARYDGSLDKYVEVTVTDMQATMRIDGNCIADNIKPTPRPLFCCLRRKGIRYGLLREKIVDALNAMKYDVPIEVAKGKEPVNGEDGKIDMQVNIDPDTRPQSREDGSVDYREIESFVQVGKGQVLAIKIPPTPGIPGIKVNGEEIEPTPGNEIKLPQGKNTSISEDGTQLISDKSGVLSQYGQLLQVLEMLNIDKDVDFRVGNIKYSGDVVVRGSIKPGFCVEADGNVTIKGIVETAKVISRNGKVILESGIIGKGEAEIYGKAGVNIGFCQEAKSIETDGILTITKYCLHSNIKCSVLEANDKQSSIVGGDITIYNHAEIRQLGNDHNVETKIHVVDKVMIQKKEKIAELEKLKSELTKKKDPIEKQIKTKAAIFKNAKNSVNEKLRAEMKKWIDTYNAVNMKLKYIQQQLEKINASMKETTNRSGYIKVTGDIYPGTIISLYGTTKVIKNILANKSFKVTKDGLEAV